MLCDNFGVLSCNMKLFMAQLKKYLAGPYQSINLCYEHFREQAQLFCSSQTFLHYPSHNVRNIRKNGREKLIFLQMKMMIMIIILLLLLKYES